MRNTPMIRERLRRLRLLRKITFCPRWVVKNEQVELAMLREPYGGWARHHDLIRRHVRPLMV